MSDFDKLVGSEMGCLIDSEPERKIGGAQIDYENPWEVADLMVKHLAKIFIATHKQKIEKELRILKEQKKPKQLNLF